MFFLVNHRLQRLLFISVFFVATIWSSTPFATALPQFNASFSVEALGMTLGQAKHALSCEGAHCLLTSSAKPSGLAALFSSDSSVETVSLVNDENQFTWLKYEKIGTTVKDGQTKTKTSTLLLDKKAKQIRYLEKNRQWPEQSKVFDAISLAYAMQHALINERPLEGFYLQDTNFQDQLEKSNESEKTTIQLSVSKDVVSATKFSFKSEHTQIELWLLSKHNYFPGKIRVVNHHQKTITLTLSELPKYYETQR